MHTPSPFAPAFLRAITRTFYTPGATPEGVRLRRRPRKRSWHMAVTGLLEAGTAGTRRRFASARVGDGLRAPEEDSDG